MKKLTLSLLLLCSVSQAEIYRWVDDKGQVHFSDRAPADQRYDQPYSKITEIESEVSQAQLEEHIFGTWRFEQDFNEEGVQGVVVGTMIIREDLTLVIDGVLKSKGMPDLNLKSEGDWYFKGDNHLVSTQTITLMGMEMTDTSEVVVTQISARRMVTIDSDGYKVTYFR